MRPGANVAPSVTPKTTLRTSDQVRSISARILEASSARSNQLKH